MPDRLSRGLSRLIGGGLILLALLLCADPVGMRAALAQDEAAAAAAPTALPEPLTREALRDLLARLSDAEVRELLLAQLDREISEADAAEAPMIGDMDRQSSALRESWRAMFAAVTELPGVPRFFAGQLIGERSPGILLWIALGLALIFGVGILAERLYRWAIRDVRRQVFAAQPASAPARVGYSLLALLLDLVGVASSRSRRSRRSSSCTRATCRCGSRR